MATSKDIQEHLAFMVSQKRKNVEVSLRNCNAEERRQFEEACIEMKKKQRLLIGGNNKLYNKNKVKSLEKKSLSAYEFIIYEYGF